MENMGLKQQGSANILRAKTKYLFDRFALTKEQENNTEMNLRELEKGMVRLASAPRRLVLELTNACNLHCIMCGREAVKFTPTFFQMEWLKKMAPVLGRVEEVSLFGWGEPTVHPKFADILRYLDGFPVRKYFCTNGMRLDALHEAIFACHVDIIAVSLDGGCAETNNRIRRGGDFEKIANSLRAIVARKKKEKLDRPYMNFVFCAMDDNLEELPKLVELAADIGLEEVKVVYFTAFDDALAKESLWGQNERIATVFQAAEETGRILGVSLKLPHIPGQDEAGNKAHKDCFVGWRDLFLGSDGYVRPCMSTPEKFFRFADEAMDFMDIWNHEAFQRFRDSVNQQDRMSVHCKNCYQSSHCNWNKKESFIQTGQNFAPEWDKQTKSLS